MSRAIVLVGLLAVVQRAAAYGPGVEYALNCQGCHRADGAGTPGSVPSLADSVARFLTVPGGREYLVQVPGGHAACVPPQQEQRKPSIAQCRQ